MGPRAWAVGKNSGAVSLIGERFSLRERDGPSFDGDVHHKRPASENGKRLGRESPSHPICMSQFQRSRAGLHPRANAER